MFDLDQFAGRHPAVRTVLRFFGWKHLPDPLQEISKACAMLAEGATLMIDDHPMLTQGLHHLLHAKDAFVRALADQEGIVPDQNAPSGPQAPAATIPVPAEAPSQQEPAQPADHPGWTVAHPGDSGGAGAGTEQLPDDAAAADAETVTTPEVVTHPEVITVPDVTEEAASDHVAQAADHPINAPAAPVL